MAKSAKEVWEQLAPSLNWDDSEIFVSYETIKGIGGEPRLAAKFDQSDARPQLLIDKDRFIMPTAKGYILHKGSAYRPLEPAIEVRKFKCEAPDVFTYGPGSAEHMHLRYALRQGVFADFLETQEPLIESWSGRRFLASSKYRFGSPIEHAIASAQIEVDMGLALGRSEIILIEGKNARYKDFNARQLFLPYLDAKNRAPGTRVTTMFFEIHQPGVYTLRSFSFKGNDICSIKETKAVKYELQFTQRVEDYVFQFNSTADVPQANDPQTVLSSVGALVDGPRTSAQMAAYLTAESGVKSYSERQGQYYANAARILGLAERVENTSKLWRITTAGSALMGKNTSDRQRELVRRVGLVPSVELFLSDGREAVEEELQQSGLSAETAKRRTDTISNWVKWLNP